MNIIVHMLFSYKMRKIIQNESGTKLNLLGFMYGNILPDLSSDFNSQPHNINASLNYIIKRAHSLEKKEYGDTFRRCYSYSKNLGVITHYLSDYFCYPHQDHYGKGLKDHSIYELIMIGKYRKGLRNYREKFGGSYYYLAPKDYKKWILEKHFDYYRNTGSCVNDISHAIYAGSMIGGNMIKNCLHSGCKINEQRSPLTKKEMVYWS